MAKTIEEIKNITSISTLKTELIRVNRELKAAYKTIDKLIRETKEKDEKLGHMETLLEQNVPVLIENKAPQTIIEVAPPAEEEIAVLQLEKLRNDARKRKLTLEESRQYDIYVKNLKLSKENVIEAKKTTYTDVSEEELLKAIGPKDDKSKK